MATSLTSAGVRFPDNSVQSTPAFTGFRNRIINGDMRINQRDNYVSFTVGTNATKFVTDRFVAFSSGGQTWGINSSGLPAGSGFNYGLLLQPQTGATSVQLRHRIESLNSADLAGHLATLSFWIYTTGLSGASSYVQPLTPTVSDTYGTSVYSDATSILYTNGQWVKNVVTFNTSSSSMDATKGLEILWNFVNAVGSSIWITGVQLEKGSSATDFEFRPYQVEFAMCQRYYETGTVFAIGYQVTGGSLGYMAVFAVTKRTTPIIVATNAAVSSAAVSATPAVGTITVGSFSLFHAITATNAISWRDTYTASAEL